MTTPQTQLQRFGPQPQMAEHLALAPDREPRLRARGTRDVAAEFLQMLPAVAIDVRRGVLLPAMGLAAERFGSGDGHMAGRRSCGVITQCLDRTARLRAERGE